MNLDLFQEEQAPRPSEYFGAWDGWVAQLRRAGQVRESTLDVYRHMWSALTAWAVGRGLFLKELTAADLDAYLASRGGADELSDRYAWRLLRLVERVCACLARTQGVPENRAATELLEMRPDIKYANASDTDPLPDFLPAAEAKRLVAFLSSVRPGRGDAGRAWQEVRNRCAVGLMLGAGLAPGEVRALQLKDVIVTGGRVANVPWKLRVAASGPQRETPLALWAGQLLRAWLNVRLEQGIPGTQVFPSTRSSGKPWGKVAQYNATREVLQAAGLDDLEGGSYRLRHTFALRQLRRGKSPEDVAAWLGVVDPGVMARYRRVLTAPVDLV